jgi:hypothetical protein
MGFNKNDYFFQFLYIKSAVQRKFCKIWLTLYPFSFWIKKVKSQMLISKKIFLCETYATWVISKKDMWIHYCKWSIWSKWKYLILNSSFIFRAPYKIWFEKWDICRQVLLNISFEFIILFVLYSLNNNIWLIQLEITFHWHIQLIQKLSDF